MLHKKILNNQSNKFFYLNFIVQYLNLFLFILQHDIEVIMQLKKKI